MSIVQRARDLAGYDEVSQIRQHQDYDWVLSLVERRPRRIADLGCGTGALLAAVTDRWPGHLDLLGIDGSPERVQEAKHRLGPSARVWQDDLLRLPQLVERFDLITMTSVLHWLYPDEHLLYSWIARHLAAGGDFVLTTHHPQVQDDGFGAEDLVARAALLALGRPAELGDVVPMAVRARPAVDIGQQLSRFFKVAEVEERVAPVVAESAGQYADFHASTFGTYFSRLVADHEQEDFFRAVGEVAAAWTKDKGSVYDITVRAWRLGL
ncbi:class I SAM-dependent methyltransferase [Micromonospora arborensis]|uniref:class I SAM-dependent methyltransferase n=1 Tax=Micromonospora TaxID=1873 RepID=UPI00341AF384